MSEQDEIRSSFDELQADIDKLSEIEQELYEAAIRAATEPW